jgi:uncharacterized alpha-E superfamily protein
MLARIAQELFWLGRDLTRAEHTARMLDGAFHADVVSTPAARGVTLSWEGVVAIIGAKPPAPGATPELTLDADTPASIRSCVARARERGRALRDVISTEMWEALNSFYLSLWRYEEPAALPAGTFAVYQEVKERCALFWGLVDRTMLRDEGRSFLEAGGRIETADMVLRMLRVAVPVGMADGGGGEGEALALLRAVGGLQAYRRAVRHAPTLPPVVRFLLYDDGYPGSVASSVDALRAALQTADAQPRTSPPVLRLGRLIADLELHRRTPEEPGGLHRTLERVQEELELVDHDIDERYFAIAALAAVHL